MDLDVVNWVKVNKKNVKERFIVNDVKVQINY